MNIAQMAELMSKVDARADEIEKEMPTKVRTVEDMHREFTEIRKILMVNKLFDETMLLIAADLKASVADLQQRLDTLEEESR